MLMTLVPTTADFEVGAVSCNKLQASHLLFPKNQKLKYDSKPNQSD